MSKSTTSPRGEPRHPKHTMVIIRTTLKSTKQLSSGSRIKETSTYSNVSPTHLKMVLCVSLDEIDTEIMRRILGCADDIAKQYKLSYILEEKSPLKKMQMVAEAPKSYFMKDIREHISKLIKTVANRYVGDPKHLGGGAFGQIFELKPENSNLPVALKLQLNQDEETLDQIEKEIAIAQKVRHVLMEEFYSGTIPLFDTLQFKYGEELIFICQEMGVEDSALETEIESRIKAGQCYTYFNLMKVCNEVCQCLLKM